MRKPWCSAWKAALREEHCSYTSVGPEAMACLMPRQVGGYNLESPVDVALAAAQHATRLQPSQVDADAVQTAEYFLQQAKMALSSKRVICERLAIDDR